MTTDQRYKPTFGVLSVLMPVLSVLVYLFAGAFRGLDPFLMGLVIILGLPFAGTVCAVVGIARWEHPIAFSMVGLVLNLAIPLLFFICASMGIGSAWVDL